MKIQKFEEVTAWQKARELTKLIYKITGKDSFSRDWTLRDQIRAASISIMSNIAEGFDSGFPSEFARFLNIAKRSASEIQSQIYIAFDQDYVDRNDFDEVYKNAESIRKLLSGFIRYLKGINR